MVCVMKKLLRLRFVADEHGGGTVLGLLWFILLVGITGLAVDTTNGFRNRTMLQATADAAALAAVIDLPDENAAIASAVAYSSVNMPSAAYGDVLHPSDVEIGVWEPDTRTFLETGFATGTPLDAARVTLHQDVSAGNPVPVNFLRIIGLQSWNVNVLAVAQAFQPKCLRNGMVARGHVDITSNNGFVNEICIHGQQGVEMQNHNFFELGVEVSMPDLADLTIPSGGMESNPGLPAALREQDKDPRLVDRVNEIMTDFLDPTSNIIPAYIDTAQPVIEINAHFDFGSMVPGRIYHGVCRANRILRIPADAVISNVVLISDCGIELGANSTIINSVLGSRSGGGNSGPTKSIISAPAGAQIGQPDNCAPGGGVQMFSNASMHFASTTSFDGVQIVAAENVQLGARDLGVNGISIQAGGDIDMTANNEFGLCQGGVPQLARFFYWRLVR